MQYRLVILMLSLMLLSSCFFFRSEEKYVEDYNKISYKKINNWGSDKQIIDGINSFKNSCKVFNNRADDSVVTTKPVTTAVRDWKAVCEPVLNGTVTNNNAKAYFEKNFDFYLMGNKGEGLVTGYYHIFMKGSRQKTDKYKFPIYALPSDLVEINLADFDLKKLNGIKPFTIIGRVSGRKVYPYFNAREIENGAIENKAEIIAYVDNPIERFLMHVQGSGSILLDDGTRIKLEYFAKNGLAFRGIGNQLLNSGLLPSRLITVETMLEAYKKNPKAVMNMILNNNSYIFFKESNTTDVIGAMGVPLSAQRSVAVDPKYISYGVPIWLEMQGYTGKINHIVVAQDTGGVILGRNRLDFYWGDGYEAGIEAGRTSNSASVYILIPKV